MSNIPDTFPIHHDNHHARQVGRTSDGRQFFLTRPFVPATRCAVGREFVALFTFDLSGNLLDAQIDDLGPRGELETDAAPRLCEERLTSLGDIEFGDIRIVPFKVERFGVKFGMIPVGPKDEEDSPVIEMHPGNYMAFYEPWNGDYDT